MQLASARHRLLVLVLCLTAVVTVPAAAQDVLLYSFNYPSADGIIPYGGLIADAKGNFYGTTIEGGSVGAPYGFDGIVFELSPASGGTWTYKILYNFGTQSGDGIQPLAALVMDASGNLFGTCSSGGANNNSGTVWELSPASGGTWTEKTIYNFGASVTDGVQPAYGALIFDAKGNLYGTTHKGGANSVGMVFELTPGSGGTWTEKVLYNFGVNSTDAASPTAGVVFDAAGNLYGTTKAGGTYAYGTVYELTPATGTWKETILHSFDLNNIDGAQPTAGVIFDSQGNLYGTTYEGGGYANGNGFGTVYELTPGATGQWTEQVLWSFTGSTDNGDGQNPLAGVIFDPAGNLYGTTTYGGIPQEGTVFALTRVNGVWKEKVLYSFSAALSDGHVPYGELLFDAAGNLYGTTTAGGSNSFGQYGTVFKLPDVVTAAPTFSPPGGAYASGQKVTISDATAGALIYYTLNEGATATLYSGPITVSSSTTIAAFATSSAQPQSQTAVANYQIGTTAATPEFNPPGGTYVLPEAVTLTDAAPGATIYYTTNGTTPTTSSTKYTSPITVAATETIKAIAVAKGYTNSAVGSSTYTITPVVPPVEKVLYSFGGTTSDGGVSYASLTFDSAGNLYGTTEYGGTHSITYGQKVETAGTVFELVKGTGGAWTEKVLYNFGATSTDGALPIAGVVFDSKGNLYGTTYGGGTCGLGTVFELSPGTGGAWTEKILHSFGCTLTDGEVPESNLIFDSAGNLYGTTEAGGAYDTVYGGASNGYGTVFEMSPGTGGTWTEKVLYSFSYLNQTDGYYPTSGVVFDSHGNLFGSCSDGGTGQDLEGGGAVYELSPAGGGGWTQKVIFSFGGGASYGYRLIGGVVLDAAGNIYGTAFAGGNAFGLDGTLWELSPVGGGWQQTVLHSFGAYETDGINPTATLVMDSKGHLYGTTNAGGAYKSGVVFEMSPQTGGGWTETVLHSFDLNGTDAADPWAGLILDASGNLYGATTYGGKNGGNTQGFVGGAVYEIQTASTTSTPTTTTLASSLNPSTYGQAVTFTATVTSSSGTPAGTVTFKNGTTTLGSASLSAGVAKFATAKLAGGTSSITAVYAGNSTYASSTSTALSQLVNKATTTTKLASLLNPEVFGQSVTLTATVTAEFGGTVAGTVTFKNGTTSLGTAAVSAGVAKLVTTKLPVGTLSLTAVYAGNTSLLTSTSPALSEVVKKATSKTALTSSANPSTVGESVTFTATVSPEYSGTPTGSVTFKNGTTTLGTVTLSAGVAKYTTSTLTSGTHTITATYGGSTSFSGSSASLTQTVN